MREVNTGPPANTGHEPLISSHIQAGQAKPPLNHQRNPGAETGKGRCS
jgi:hypothetical protein